MAQPGHYNDNFLTKFEPKKTTDECYTPSGVYEAIIDWIEKTDNSGILKTHEIIRPFYPGGNYETEDYTGKVVIDNPPFSIITKITRFYEERKIPYFLFAPALSLFNIAKGEAHNYIITNATVIYKNGAKVDTSFVSNIFEEKVIIAGKLRDKIEEVCPVRKYNRVKVEMQSETFSAAQLGKYTSKHRDIILDTDGKLIKKDANGREIYGSAFTFAKGTTERLINY